MIIIRNCKRCKKEIPKEKNKKTKFCSHTCRKRFVDKSYANNKGPVCVNCNFIPEHSCQLDVDHIDGNHSNNDPSNLETICANCHRLKTYYRKDWKKAKTPSAAI